MIARLLVSGRAGVLPSSVPSSASPAVAASSSIFQLAVGARHYGTPRPFGELLVAVERPTQRLLHAEVLATAERPTAQLIHLAIQPSHQTAQLKRAPPTT